MEASGTEVNTENAAYVRTKSLTNNSSENAAACQSRAAWLRAWPARSGYDTLARARGCRDSVLGASAHARVGHAHLVRGDANEVGTTTATADAADHARGRRWMAPGQCRAASAYNVPPQPPIARPGGGRH